MTTTAEILDRAAAKPGAGVQAQPTREQLENAIKSFDNFRTAVRAGQYRGHEAIHITALLSLLDHEYSTAVGMYENGIKLNPEWAQSGDVRKGPVG